jgi:AcrR family transcriptional regulator
MRVTAEAQAATRERILAVAQELFASQGFEAATTRDIARAAGIATGTMFNYFNSKEAIVGCLAAQALGDIKANCARADGEHSTFEEDLFAFVAAGLRKLKPIRKHLPAILGTTLSPECANADDEARFLRVSHLESVEELAHRHGLRELPSLAMQMYWSLYTGLLLFWAADTSPRQEDTLALLDHSVKMFVNWVSSQTKSQKR